MYTLKGDFPSSFLVLKRNPHSLDFREPLKFISPGSKHLKIWSKAKFNHANCLYYQWKDLDSSPLSVISTADMEV